MLIGGHRHFSGNSVVNVPYDCRSVRVIQQHVKCIVLC